MAINIISEEEVTRLRQETKGTNHTIHFNNAGSSLPPDVVVQTVIDYLSEEAEFGGYETEFKYREQLENVYSLIGQLINAHPDEIALVENASIGWGYAFNGISFKKGDVILTSEMEYVTNLMTFLHVQKTHEVSFQVIPNDEYGNFCLQALEDAITPQTKLIAITHIPSAAGGMMPVVEIGEIARKHHILYLVDACQTVGHAPIDVKAINCDFLSVTGRKYLRAPRGTGFLFVRKEIQDQLDVMVMDGHTGQLTGQNDYHLRNNARRFELYEKSRALTVGLAQAVSYALDIGVDRIWQRIQHLSGLLRTELSNIDTITVHDFGSQQCGIVTFSVSGMDSYQVKNKLAEKNINVSVSLAQSTLIYMNKNNLTTIVRASVHYYNTEEEIMKLCNTLRTI
ncbi:aminotransferase class V-fold PLP-dependent enzyme [Mucilaginibacter sp. SP1R1]|uniref:aminotransferase class V-fold PLP-dependent enzyme n=1 Tax=Mucilaginibacter sp. SP1R1 TaxID=2723091 RepID=UPI0017FD9B4B|nr:aminotransferase class V-fold PLP-dependent enzyme [Mucilaginibacter sp. SP1R1]MBB6147668.1 selenocysteine lyase/cysteine desulfurase [Mucilaginibacter sp. SP1R1]